MHKYKAGDVVQILDTKDNCDRHDSMPDIYIQNRIQWVLSTI